MPLIVCVISFVGYRLILLLLLMTMKWCVIYLLSIENDCVLQFLKVLFYSEELMKTYFQLVSSYLPSYVLFKISL